MRKSSLVFVRIKSEVFFVSLIVVEPAYLYQFGIHFYSKAISTVIKQITLEPSAFLKLYPGLIGCFFKLEALWFVNLCITAVSFEIK